MAELRFKPGLTLKLTRSYFIKLHPKRGMERKTKLEIIIRREQKVITRDPNKSFDSAEPEPDL